MAKAILFRASEKIYGVKPNALGDLRYITVPYALAYLNQATHGKLDLLKIWKQQRLSETLGEQLRNLMVQIEKFIKSNAPGSLYGEWAKKEACWESVSKKKFNLDLVVLADDMVTPSSLKKRETLSNDEANEIIREQTIEYLRGIPVKTWNTIDDWGRMTGNLTQHQRMTIYNIAIKVKSNRSFLDSELQNGPEIIELVMEKAPELFENTEDDVLVDAPYQHIETNHSITLDIVQKLVNWDRKNRRLKAHHFLYMKDIAEGRKPLTPQNAGMVQINIERLKKFGFQSDE